MANRLEQWFSTKPAWQGRAYARLWRGDSLTAEDYRQIAEGMTRGETTDRPRPVPNNSDIKAKHEGAVVFESVRIIANVNNLPPNEKLEFADHGITLIYGQNGSGKSGYARILKIACQTSPIEYLHPNVYAASYNDIVEAEISARIGDVAMTRYRLSEVPQNFSRAHFFDSACCTDYVHRESSLEYQSREIGTLKQLADLFDRVGQELDQKIRANENMELAPLKLSDAGTAQSFLASLTYKTTREAIMSACARPDSLEVDLERQRAITQSFENDDPNAKQVTLSRQADACAKLIDHFEQLQIHLGSAQLAELRDLAKQAELKRSSAQLALQNRFPDTFIAGVGTEEWITLWNAARQVSTQHAYPGHDFPHQSGGARCVLCQQLLSDDAKERMRSFEEAVSEELGHEAEEIDSEVEVFKVRIKSVPVRSDAIDGAIFLVRQLDEHIAQRVGHAISAYEQAQVAVASGKFSDAHDRVQALQATVLLPALHSIENEQRTAANALSMEDMPQQIIMAKQKLERLEDTAVMADSFELIVAEVDRRKECEHLKKCKRQTDTTQMSRFISELTGEILKDRMATFENEAHELGLERATLKDLGSRKGDRKTRIELMGKQLDIEPWLVLSEGEQRAAGLARYFADVEHDEERSALVLDDPVSSLDHLAREAVASRIAKFAQDRQVIVFTHDIALIIALHEAADQQPVEITTRSVQRDGASGMPGVVHPDHPWEASDTKKRFNQLVEDARNIKKGRADWDDGQYADEVAQWAGRLSESLERAVRRIVGRVVDPATSHVKPDLFRTLAKITEQDNRDFKRIYSLTSKWARRHDIEPSLNYSAPSVEEVEQVAEDAQRWFNTVWSQAAPKT